MCFFRIFFLSIITFLLFGCKNDNQVQHYRVAKEKIIRVSAQDNQNPTPGQNPPEMPGLAESTQGLGQPTWTVPEGWVEQPKGNMRKGSFSITKDDKSAEVSVLAFPGDVGGVLANINRWAGQISHPAVDDDFVASLVSQEVDGIHGKYIKLTGPKESVLAVIIMKDGTSWFFKLKGDNNLADSEEENFIQFVESVKF